MDLACRLDAAVRATPGVRADVAEFVDSVEARLAAAENAERELAELHIEDMYLAWALGRGDTAAFARFERDFMAQLPLQIQGVTAEAGELEQLVRTRLFVASEGQSARITQYSGRGPFGGWLRMVATRCLLDLKRRRKGAAEPPELDSPEVATDPELDYLKLRHAADFKIVLERALTQLEARQVTLLKLSFIEQLSPSAIGTMYGVSARTVQRWLVELREALRAATREGLRARLALTPSELESFLGLVDSQLHVSLHRVLGHASSPE
ncbi:MAG TPA: sigma-70 family RNA polymerase sigma factor [Polyangiaceae bacterium]|nr:sigma-70 family RNA polymerase sigma factor [Polyangiaceae bacterium]